MEPGRQRSQRRPGSAFEDVEYKYPRLQNVEYDKPERWKFPVIGLIDDIDQAGTQTKGAPAWPQE